MCLELRSLILQMVHKVLSPIAELCCRVLGKRWGGRSLNSPVISKPGHLRINTSASRFIYFVRELKLETSTWWTAPPISPTENVICHGQALSMIIVAVKLFAMGQPVGYWFNIERGRVHTNICREFRQKHSIEC